MRGVTQIDQLSHGGCVISTRTPHAGSDPGMEWPRDESGEFQPALPMRGVTRRFGHRLAQGRFQPALPMRGVTMSTVEGVRAWQFQPALPMRGVTRQRPQGSTGIRFQPALPMRGVTIDWEAKQSLTTFQPALPMRGVTSCDWSVPMSGQISTRTPHAGSDLETVELFWFASISTRTPHAGSDHALNKIIAVHADFNPHSPCGE